MKTITMKEFLGLAKKKGERTEIEEAQFRGFIDNWIRTPLRVFGIH